VLSEADKQVVVARVVRLEAATGVRVVTAVVPRADAYPEIAWKAFALAASLAALAVVAADAWRPDWISASAALLHVMPVLVAGALSAACAAFVPGYARMFLHAPRRDGEVRQCAESMFLDHDLASMPARIAVLILIARFERKVELIADRGFRGRIAPAEWSSVVDATAALLAQRAPAAALVAGLDRLETLLCDRGFIAAHGSACLPADAPIEATGA
jgi:uncharacterized membrane protein